MRPTFSDHCFIIRSVMYPKLKCMFMKKYIQSPKEDGPPIINLSHKTATVDARGVFTEEDRL